MRVVKVMGAVAIAFLVGIAAYNDRGYIAYGGETILQMICIAYAIVQIKEGVSKDEKSGEQT